MNIPVDIQIDFLWGNKHFQKSEWSPITYIVGANGTGKSIFAERLKLEFKSHGLKVRYFGADRIANLGNKWDTALGPLASDKSSKGINMDNFSQYKTKAELLGQSIDALIELNNKIDLQIKVESILSDIFHKQLVFDQKGGFLNCSLTDITTGKAYDLKKDESHGLKEIITLLTFLYSDEYNCLILDEPELNLHPQFQQYILQEIKKCSGTVTEGKKMFVILTHSPYMLDINNSDDLLNYVVFHKGNVPTYITEYKLDAYQLDRLNKLLLRINTNHKTLFFASSPVFVEGYIDQQLFNLIENKRDVPLGAEGVSVIDVGGKDEVDIMYSLCRSIGIDAKAIVDLDALLEGKIRQTIGKNEKSTKYLASKGQDDLISMIGQLQSLLTEIANALEKIDNNMSDDSSKEFIDMLNVIKNISGEKVIQAKRRITLLGLQRIPEEIIEKLGAEYNVQITKAKALTSYALRCFEIAGVFILQNGEMENCYLTYNENQYSIADSKKTEYFLTEYNFISELSKEDLEEKYPLIIEMLDKICSVTNVNMKKMISVKLSEWIHRIQSLHRLNNSLDKEYIESHPKAQWDIYKRIIEIIDVSVNEKEKSFICKFKINPQLEEEDGKIYQFDQDTVPSKFEI